MMRLAQKALTAISPTRNTFDHLQKFAYQETIPNRVLA